MNSPKTSVNEPFNGAQKHIVLYSDDKGVRHIAQLGVNTVHAPVKFIGISTMTETTVKGVFDLVETQPVIFTDAYNDLYGKLLTMCDALVADKTQREALKSIIKETVSSWYTKNTGYAYKMTKQLSDIRKEVDA